MKKYLLLLFAFLGLLIFISFTTKAQSPTSKPISSIYTDPGSSVVKVKRYDGVVDSTITKKSLNLISLKYWNNYPVNSGNIWGYGDSFMYGSGATITSRRFFSIEAYFTGYTENNNGVPGTLLHGFSASSIHTKGATDKYLEFNFGINDYSTTNADSTTYTTAQFISDWTTIITTAISSKGWAAGQIIIHSVPYTPNFAGQSRLLNWNRQLKALCSTYGVIYSDIYNQILNNGGPQLTDDGLHPNDRGHKIIALLDLSLMCAPTDTHVLSFNANVYINRLRINANNTLPGNYNDGILGVDKDGNLSRLNQLPVNTWARGNLFIGGSLIDSLALMPSSYVPGDHILRAGSRLISSVVDPTIYGYYQPMTTSGDAVFYDSFEAGSILFKTSGGSRGGSITALALQSNGNAVFGNNINIPYSGYISSFVAYTNKFTQTTGNGQTIFENLYPWSGGYTGGYRYITAPVTGGVGVETHRLFPSGSPIWQPAGVSSESISAVGQVETTARGSLTIPRMTAAQRDAIVKECVASISVASGGSGYSANFSAVFNTFRSDGSDADASVTVSGGVVTDILLNKQGWGYRTIPTVTGGMGSGATFNITMTWRLGLAVYVTDDTANDSSTGVLEIWNGSAWKKAW